jgi:hypothetical protein
MPVRFTTDQQSIIGTALKADKSAWMQRRQEDENLQKHLLLIHQHGAAFPNAGSVLAALDDVYGRLSALKEVSNPLQLISIVIDIGYHSPRCFPAAAAIVSKLLSLLPNDEQRLAAIHRIRRRLSQLPNNGHLEVWLQRITYNFDPDLPYAEKLCELVNGQPVELWNMSWITDLGLKAAADPSKILSRGRLKVMRPVVPRVEFIVFEAY